MLNAFRRLAGSTWAKILLGFLIVSFGIWGIGDVLRSSGGDENVASVGGSSIPQADYARAMRHEMQQLRAYLGNDYSPELLRQMGIETQVLEKIINSTLLALECRKLGLVPSDQDVVRNIRSNPSYQDDKGNFDKKILEAGLRNAQMTEKAYVEQLRKEMAVNLLADTVSGAATINDAEVRILYQMQEEQRTADIYRLSPSLAAPMPQPSQAQIEAYYQAHAKAFDMPETRTVSYVSLGRDSLGHASLSEDQLRAAYQQHIDEFKKPERRTVEQLLFGSEDKARNAYGLLKKGQAFSQVAKQSDILNKNALSLGVVERGKVIDGTDNAIFSLREGEFTEPVKTTFGWHIFRVNNIQPASTLNFEEARPALEKNLQQADGDDALYKLANRLEDALAGGSSLQEAAKDLGLHAVTLPPIDNQGRTMAGTAPDALLKDEKFLDTVFKTDEKTESPLITAKEGYYILRVDSINPEHARKLEDVTPQVIAGWTNAEREKRLSVLAHDLAAQFATDAGRAAAIRNYRLTPISSGTIKRSAKTVGDLALPPALVSDIFARKPGDATGAYIVSGQQKNAPADYLIAVVSGITPADASKKNPQAAAAIATLRGQLNATAQQEILEQYLRYLRSKYPVRINRAVAQDLPQG